MESNSNVMGAGTKIFFPNLNGVRFLAALLVIIQHTEEAKIKIQLPTSYRNDGALGALGVSLFFVLSGFLITYLLQSEKLYSGTISLRNFYTRRVLRIWPLYYLIIFLGFWFIPNVIPAISDEASIRNLSNQFNTQLLLDLFFLPNVALILFPPIQFIAPIWSVGVEEQFYLIWPLLVKYFNNLLKPLIAVIFIFIGLNALFYISLLYLSNVGTSPDLQRRLYYLMKFTAYTRMDCMAVGGVGAWILFNKKDGILNIIYSIPVQIVTYLLLITFMVKGVKFSFLAHLPYSILFIIILLNLSSNKRTIVSLKNSVFEYLGKISYGLYMFHQIAIAISIKIVTIYYFAYIGRPSNTAQLISTNVVLYSLVMCTVTVVSMISYNYFEKYFLAKKMKFSTIISGDSVDVKTSTEFLEGGGGARAERRLE